MTKDDILSLMKETGELTRTPFDEWCLRFANSVYALAAEREREECAKWLDFYDGPNCRRAEAIRARGTHD